MRTLGVPAIPAIIRCDYVGEVMMFVAIIVVEVVIVNV